MIRAAIVTVVVVCLAFTVAAGEETAEKEEIKLEDLKLPLSSLNAWKTRAYTYQIDRRGELSTVGKIIMRTEVDGEKTVLHDTWALEWRGRKMSLDLQMECKATSLLRPTLIKSVGQGDDELVTFSAEVGEGDALVKYEDGKQREIDFPADTVTDIAMFRIFSLLPREEGTRIKLGHVLEVSELNLKGPAQILYVGKERIPLHDDEVELHKFVCKRDGRIIEEAWVDDKGTLRRLRIDGRKIITEVPADTQ